MNGVNMATALHRIARHCVTMAASAGLKVSMHDHDFCMHVFMHVCQCMHCVYVCTCTRMQV